jgi:hypothetical protein
MIKVKNNINICLQQTQSKLASYKGHANIAEQGSEKDRIFIMDLFS